MSSEDNTEFQAPEPLPGKRPEEAPPLNELTEEAEGGTRRDVAEPTATEKTPATSESAVNTGAAPTGTVRESNEPTGMDQDLTQAQCPEEVNTAERLSQGKPEVPGYEVLDRLGQGSYGEVWRAREQRTGIEVAIKFLLHGGGLHWQLLQAEVKQLAMLHSDPGIVQLLDVEPEATPPYYIMELARRGSLARRLEGGPLPVGEALEIFRQMTEALAYVHAKGIRHCDLKPGNILLDARGRVRMADFGQAHLSSDAAPALGTFFYMAPEQADLSKQIPDTRWDVYGLGALLFMMVTGKRPREDPRIRGELANTEQLPHRLERYREWVRTAPRPAEHRRAPGMDRPLAEIIDRCLEIDPSRRLPDAAAVLAALARRERQRRQKPLLVFGILAPFVLLLAMAGLGTMVLNTSIEQSELALTRELEELSESDLVTARLVAKAVDDQLKDLVRTVKVYAKSPELRQALQARDRKRLTPLLQTYFKAAKEEGDYARWVVTDGKGKITATYPEEETVLGLNLSWRDWFNGKGDQLGERDRQFEPISKPHISQPFVGKSKSRPRIISISTPVFAGDEKTIDGVLLVTVLLDELHSWLYETVKLEHGFVVVLNDRGHYLHHENKAAITPRYLQNPHSLSPELSEQFLAAPEGLTTYVDPIDKRTYLAAHAPLRAFGWAVLVQHDRNAALEPLDSLKGELQQIFWIALISVGLLISALWAALLWTLRRSSRLEDEMSRAEWKA